jgi:hypothetical protein
MIMVKGREATAREREKERDRERKGYNSSNDA